MPGTIHPVLTSPIVAYSIQIDPPARLGIVTFSGIVDGRDLMDSIAALYEHADWEPDFDMLWDASAISQLIIDPADVQRIAAQSNEYAHRIGPGRTAMVLTREIDLAINRLMLHRQGPRPRERRVFDRIAPAMAWLRGEEASDANAASTGEAA